MRLIHQLSGNIGSEQINVMNIPAMSPNESPRYGATIPAGELAKGGKLTYELVPADLDLAKKVLGYPLDGDVEQIYSEMAEGWYMGRSDGAGSRIFSRMVYWLNGNANQEEKVLDGILLELGATGEKFGELPIKGLEVEFSIYPSLVELVSKFIYFSATSKVGIKSFFGGNNSSVSTASLALVSCELGSVGQKKMVILPNYEAKAMLGNSNPAVFVVDEMGKVDGYYANKLYARIKQRVKQYMLNVVCGANLQFRSENAKGAVSGDAVEWPRLSFENCKFTSNYAQKNDPFGKILVHHASKFTNCTFGSGIELAMPMDSLALEQELLDFHKGEAGASLGEEASETFKKVAKRKNALSFDGCEFDDAIVRGAYGQVKGVKTPTITPKLMKCHFKVPPAYDFEGNSLCQMPSFIKGRASSLVGTYDLSGRSFDFSEIKVKGGNDIDRINPIAFRCKVADLLNSDGFKVQIGSAEFANFEDDLTKAIRRANIPQEAKETGLFSILILRSSLKKSWKEELRNSTREFAKEFMTARFESAREGQGSRAICIGANTNQAVMENCTFGYDPSEKAYQFRNGNADTATSFFDVTKNPTFGDYPVVVLEYKMSLAELKKGSINANLGLCVQRGTFRLTPIDELSDVVEEAIIDTFSPWVGAYLKLTGAMNPEQSKVAPILGGGKYHTFMRIFNPANAKMDGPSRLKLFEGLIKDSK